VWIDVGVTVAITDLRITGGNITGGNVDPQTWGAGIMNDGTLTLNGSASVSGNTNGNAAEGHPSRPTCHRRTFRSRCAVPSRQSLSSW
jgi:hypothetical protein